MVPDKRLRLNDSSLHCLGVGPDPARLIHVAARPEYHVSVLGDVADEVAILFAKVVFQDLDLS